MRILIIKFRHIGDVLLISPFISNLRAKYPDAEIDLAINDDCVAMFKYNPKINNIFAYPRSEIKRLSFIGRVAREWRYFQSLKRNYDMVFNLTEGDRGAIYTLFSKAPIRVGVESRNSIIKALKPYTSSAPMDLTVHIVEKNLLFLKFANIDIIDKRVELFHSRDDEESIDNILKSYGITEFIHIHPVSRWLFKCWSSEGFARVIDYVESIYKIPVIITSAPDKKEIERVDKILSLTKNSPINLCGKFSLTQLSALISRSKLFIGVDTAPMHMAAAHNIPVVALFGPTNPLSWGPWENDIAISCWRDIYETQYCGKHTVIRRDKGEILMTDEGKISTGMMRIEADSVIAEIDRYLGDNR